MSQQYPSSWKNCATCAYWLGKRQPDNFGSWVTVDSASATGKCWCLNGTWKRMDKNASLTCSYYMKWPVLR